MFIYITKYKKCSARIHTIGVVPGEDKEVGIGTGSKDTSSVSSTEQQQTLQMAPSLRNEEPPNHIPPMKATVFWRPNDTLQTRHLE